MPELPYLTPPVSGVMLRNAGRARRPTLAQALDDLTHDPADLAVVNPVQATDQAATDLDFCFTRPRIPANRFNDERTHAWYGARTLTTTVAETLYWQAAEASNRLRNNKQRDYVDTLRFVYACDVGPAALDLRPHAADKPYLRDRSTHRACQALILHLRSTHVFGAVIYLSARDDGECFCAYQRAMLANPRHRHTLVYRFFQNDTFAVQVDGMGIQRGSMSALLREHPPMYP